MGSDTAKVKSKKLKLSLPSESDRHESS